MKKRYRYRAQARQEAVVHLDRKILVVEDEEKISEVIVSYLENSGYQAIVADNGEDALALYSEHRPELIILDLMLPGMSGEQVCETIRKTSEVPIIMLTAKSDEEHIIGGLKLGADDYIAKPFSPRQLMARVEAVLRRGVKPTPAEGLVVLKDKHEVLNDGIAVNLTPIEFKILTTMMKYPEKTFTREELVIIVFGADYEGYDRTVDTHIKNLRQKIERDPKNPKRIITVHGIGYRYGG